MKHRLGVLGFSCYACFAAASFMSGVGCLIISVILIAASAVTVVIYRAANRGFAAIKSGAAFFTAALAAFFLIYAVYSAAVIEPSRGLNGFSGSIEMKALEVTRTGSDTLRITAQSSIGGRRVRFVLYSTDMGTEAGDIFTADVKFYEPRDTAQFSESSYCYSRGLFLKAALCSLPEMISHESTGIVGVINSYSDYLKSVCMRCVPDDKGGMLNAMFFGDKSGMTPELTRGMRSCGLSHLTAVSGMHLSLVINAVVLLLDTLGLKNRRKLKFVTVAVLTVLMMIFFGFTPSVRRSGIMMIVYYGALPLKRKLSFADSVGCAVLLILLFEPYACRDMGLLLSVCGTLGMSAASKLIPENAGRVKSAVLSAVCASFCTLPVSALFYGGASLVSPIASVVCYPLFALIMVIMLLFALTGGLLAEPLLFAAGLAAKVMGSFAKLLGSFRYSFIGLNTGTAAIMFLSLIYIIAAALILRSKRRAAMAGVISLCVFAGVVTLDKAVFNETAKLRVYSDGSRGMITVETPGGISLMSCGAGTKLYSCALDGLAESCSDGYLLAAVSDKSESSAYSRGFDDLPHKEYGGDANAVYNINGEYSVEVRDGIFTADIYGVTVTLAPAGTEDLSADVIVYSGYKKEYGNDGGTLTVFCDKRSDADGEGSINAYFESAAMIINKNGEYIMRG